MQAAQSCHSRSSRYNPSSMKRRFRCLHCEMLMLRRLVQSGQPCTSRAETTTEFKQATAISKAIAPPSAPTHTIMAIAPPPPQHTCNHCAEQDGQSVGHVSNHDWVFAGTVQPVWCRPLPTKLCRTDAKTVAMEQVGGASPGMKPAATWLVLASQAVMKTVSQLQRPYPNPVPGTLQVLQLLLSAVKETAWHRLQRPNLCARAAPIRRRILMTQRW